MAVLAVDDEAREERERQIRAVKRNRQVPYHEIEKAVEIARRKFPDADQIKGQLYAGAPYVEVWAEGAAKIYFVDVDGEEVLDHRTPSTPQRRTRRSRRQSSLS